MVDAAVAGGNDDEMRMLLNKWGRVDGEGVIKELAALQEAREAEGGDNARGGRGGASGEGGATDFMSAISGWATVDSDAAAEYINGIEDGRRSEIYTAGLVQGLMVNSADEAMKFISEIPENNEMRSRYTSMVASDMLVQGLDSARSWAENLTDPDLKGGALPTIASEYASQDIDAAVSGSPSTLARTMPLAP